MSNDKVLSQEEIDAMLSQAGGGSSAAPIEGARQGEVTPGPVTPTAPVGADPVGRQRQAAATQPEMRQPSNSPQPQGLDLATQAMINSMAAKVQNLDAAMERVARLERALYETNNTVRQIQQELQSNSGQIQLVSSRLEGVLANLKATLGYNAQKTFVCTNCHAKGEVAAEVKCTRCNKKNWWGWWPSKWR